MKTAVIDYGAGNLMSVINALRVLKADYFVTADYDGLMRADAAVLPGVGAFGSAMDALKSRGLSQAVKDFIASDKPFLGICLGLQLLYSGSEESGGAEGLGILPGKAVKLDAPGMKIPHIGWSSVTVKQNSSLSKCVPQREFFYFVHSYAPEINEFTAAECVYGLPFTAAAERGNILACQFHPEKSGAAGLKLIGSFLSRAESGNRREAGK